MEERLARIETLLETMTEKLDRQHAYALQRANRLDQTVYGDGNGNKGMVVRVDRLERDSSRRTWRERLIMATVIALLVKTISQAVMH